MTHKVSMKEWYHYSESSILDVTDYDDILKSLEDERLEKITDIYIEYLKIGIKLVMIISFWKVNTFAQ